MDRNESLDSNAPQNGETRDIQAATGIVASSLSGGGCTGWTQLGTTFTDTNGSGASSHQWWIGKVTATGAATATVTYSGTVTTLYIELNAQEFTAGAGAVWAADGTGAGYNSATSSATIPYPTLVPAGTGELYVGYAYINSASGNGGSTTGYTYQTLGTSGDQFIYNTSIGASTSPTGAATATTYVNSHAILVTASLPGGGGGFFASVGKPGPRVSRRGGSNQGGYCSWEDVRGVLRPNRRIFVAG
jgi:hypothetical protein